MVGSYDQAMQMAGALLREVGEALPSRQLGLVSQIARSRLLPSRPPPADAAGHYRLLRVLSDAFTWMDPPLGVYLHSRALALARELGDAEALVESYAVEAGMVAFGRGGEALATLEARLTALATAPREQAEAALHLTRGLRHLVEGSWDAAVRELRGHGMRAELAHPGDRRPEMVARFYEFEGLFRQGRLLELRAALLPHLARARSRDEVAVLAFHAVQGAFAALTVGDPDGARALLEDVERRLRARASPWTREMADSFLLVARAVVALYEGEGERAWELHGEAMGRAVRKGVLLLPYWRSTLLEVRGRCALAAAVQARGGRRRSLLRAGDRTVGLLRAVGLPWCAPLADSLAAGLAVSRGQERKALQLHRGAEARFERWGMPLAAAVERWRVGELEGGSAGAARVADARHRLREAGALVPGRFAAAFAALL